MMLHKGLFILAHECGDPSFYSTYKKLIKNQWRSYKELKEEQEKQLRNMVRFAFENVPYYHDLFRGLNLLPQDITTIEDLEKIPILTKSIIKKHWEQLKPVNLSKLKYYEWATGGSTGAPLQYRISRHDRFLSGALLYRGWGYAGYKLGERMVFLAGSSLDIGTKSKIVKNVHEIVRNVKMLSSFDMGEIQMQHYLRTISSFRPLYIRGYASSIYFFARWMEKNGLSAPSPMAILTTAEKLSPHMRNKISNVFDCEVYDNYGLNDGGVSAYECAEHHGLHIDTERSIMEIVDENGNIIEEGKGSIIATSLHNFSMPFIRYFTGDEGYLIAEKCACGRDFVLLKEIIGREQEMLSTPEGYNVHGEFITHMIWGIPHINEFQVIQDKIDHLIFNLVVEDGFDDKYLDQIRSMIKARNMGWEIEFRFVDVIDRSQSGKYKFIINEVINAK